MHNTVTHHRFGILVYDSKAAIKVLRGKPQALDPTQVQEFYQVDMNSIQSMTKSALSKRVKKLAPDVSLETCSKQESRIYSKLPKFSPSKPVKAEYDLYVPNSESVVLFNSKFESGNLQLAIR